MRESYGTSPIIVNTQSTFPTKNLPSQSPDPYPTSMTQSRSLVMQLVSLFLDSTFAGPEARGSQVITINVPVKDPLRVRGERSLTLAASC